MTSIKARAQKLAKRLLKENETRTWRKIVEEDYPDIKPGTLNRFAKEMGEYIPADENILVALGLKKPRKPAEWKQEQSIIEAMSNMTKQALRWKKRAVRSKK